MSKTTGSYLDKKRGANWVVGHEPIRGGHKPTMGKQADLGFYLNLGRTKKIKNLDFDTSLFFTF